LISFARAYDSQTNTYQNIHRLLSNDGDETWRIEAYLVNTDQATGPMS